MKTSHQFRDQQNFCKDICSFNLPHEKYLFQNMHLLANKPTSNLKQYHLKLKPNNIFPSLTGWLIDCTYWAWANHGVMYKHGGIHRQMHEESSLFDCTNRRNKSFKWIPNNADFCCYEKEAKIAGKNLLFPRISKLLALPNKVYCIEYLLKKNIAVVVFDITWELISWFASS